MMTRGQQTTESEIQDLCLPDLPKTNSETAGSGTIPCHSGNGSEADSTSTHTSDDVPVLDGGWGWVVLVGCFTINFISDGCAYSFGVLYTELLDCFHESKSKTSWVGSLFFSVPLLCGPVSSVITDRVGCRTATIVGGLIAAAGFLSSSFVQSVEALYITYGIVAGFGMSLPYLTSILIISQYFKKRLAFATGVAECGAGVGTIVFAPVTAALFSTYSWRGTMYIMAGIAANIVVCGALFRPIKGKTLSTRVKNDCKKLETRDDDTESKLLGHAREAHGDDLLCCEINTCPNGDIIFAKPATQDTTIEGETLSDAHVLPKTEKPSQDDTKHSNDPHPECVSACHRRLRGLSTSLQLTLFTHPIFLLFITSNFILYFWFDVPFVFLANRAVLSGMTETRAALLVSVIGILHTVGNLVYGVAGDMRRLSLPLLYGVSISLCGVTLLAVPSSSTFLPLACMAGVFGLLSASSEALSSILLIDILGEASLSQSYGFTMLLKGIANLVGPPVAGWLFDVSGSYDNTFYAAGTCLVIAGLMYTPTPLLRRCSRCRHADKSRLK
ncbi:monocarboxylate transporter 12-like [Haliotis rubra]|uniref:monocarboxylate transporter 12-like n=1 Tax=Haliotis rubra TaxID=36100 RepID=UPI001EE54683|nr:monocarboxylate transporter 12-like [Haliotis rubra]XP_046582945.1 monocarboxylate transporter 12-like [Haliotis rubra]